MNYICEVKPLKAGTGLCLCSISSDRDDWNISKDETALMETVWWAFTQGEIMIHRNETLSDIYKSQETLYRQHERKYQKGWTAFLKMEKEIHINDTNMNQWSGTVGVAAQTWSELGSVIFFTVSSKWHVSVWLSTSVGFLWPFTSAQANNASKNSKKLIYNQICFSSNQYNFNQNMSSATDLQVQVAVESIMNCRIVHREDL